ncbi:hypothetical protein [Vibrio rumoiensis]|uniref:hypothetical protein n=1 Tax=Vibrio rumoiensis TaxID=76258 RepID=UPI00130134DD|nr:hypothetical protein [Vibrio rumoiensis]
MPINTEIFFFIIAAFLTAAVGYYAQRIGLCMVRGVEKARHGQPSFLLAILCSSAFSWVAILAAYQIGALQHFTAYALTPLPFIG